jgi:hypothetical protein
LLRVEMQIDAPVDAATNGVSALLLTFDVGRVLLRNDPVSGFVGEQVFEANPPTPPEWQAADEEDPWWRVLGSPLSRVVGIGSGNAAEGVALQFRPDGDNPRLIAVVALGSGLVVQLQRPEN